ncbi:NF-X1-type zinc finger protein NFXL1, partial [Tanacetum coccineum]
PWLRLAEGSFRMAEVKDPTKKRLAEKWARAPTSIDLSAQKNQGFNWRGPGCQSVQLTSDDGRCRHRCVVQCHPGPCPPCKAFAPPRICPCGKKTIPTRCSNQKSLLTCGQRRGKPLKCLRHCYSKTCHVSPCDSCDVQFDASCFCKKKIKVVVCGDMAVKGHANVENDGIFSCNSSCGKPLRITSCHCGKLIQSRPAQIYVTKSSRVGHIVVKINAIQGHVHHVGLWLLKNVAVDQLLVLWNVSTPPPP